MNLPKRRKKPKSGIERSIRETRMCANCGAPFRPRPWQVKVGRGRYCSIPCRVAKAPDHLHCKDVQQKAAAQLRSLREAGLIRYNYGADNPTWKGGLKATRDRARESGKQAKRTRDYRHRNPEKIKEFSQRRADRKLGRLPRGTISRIGDAQRWRCAICRKSIKRERHVDHIIPLARGGEHKPANIQLLCPGCNMSKQHRDPIEYMQSLGRLL